MEATGQQLSTTAPASTLKISGSDPVSVLASRAARFGFPMRHVNRLEYGEVTKGAWSEISESLTSQIGTGFLYTFTGIRGTGKTQVAVELLCKVARTMIREDSDRKTQPRYVKAADMFREVRGTFGTASKRTEAEIVDGFVKSKLLVIDELQERKDSEFEDRILTNIIDKRYDAGNVDTIIISNLQRDELAKALGASIVSRIHECGKLVEFSWPSFRGTDK